jgi:hypothetical protein
MGFEPQSLVVLRLVGGLVGGVLVLLSFLRFRAGHISRFDTGLRWLFGLALVVVCIRPDSVNWVVSMLAMEQAAYGRMLALLVLSNLALWTLLLRERTKVFDVRRNVDRFIRSFAMQGGLDRHAERLAGADVLVALPALNEAENLGPVLERIPDEISGCRVGVVVIDDGSEDDTAGVAIAAGVAVVSNPLRRGQGAALRLAYDVACSIGARIVVTLDADGQHLPEEIERLVQPILDDEQDFVIGSRLLGVREKDSAVRLVGIHVNNALINLLAGTRISDCSSGFKAIRVDRLRRIELNEDQFQAAEAIISAAHAELRIGEVPITVKQRASGESKKGRDLSYGLGFARSVFRSWWR